MFKKVFDIIGALAILAIAMDLLQRLERLERLYEDLDRNMFEHFENDHAKDHSLAPYKVPNFHTAFAAGRPSDLAYAEQHDGDALSCLNCFQDPRLDLEHPQHWYYIGRVKESPA